MLPSTWISKPPTTEKKKATKKKDIHTYGNAYQIHPKKHLTKPIWTYIINLFNPFYVFAFCILCFVELNWLSFGHMKSSKAGPLFGFKPAGCRALGPRRGNDLWSRGRRCPRLPTFRKARRNSEKLASPDLASQTHKTTNDKWQREGENYFGQQKQSAKNQVKHSQIFTKHQ